MKTHNIEQGTDSWFEVRKTKMTASHGSAIWSCWAWLKTYIINKMAERFSSWEKEQLGWKDIERWNELEEQARVVYEMETWREIEEVGFIEYNEFVWCSPDWLIKWEKGGIEIKCPNDVNFFKILINPEEKSIPSAYRWQIQMSLLITWYEYWDFVAYNPNYQKNIVIIRVYPDEAKFAKLKTWFLMGQAQMEEILKKIK